MSTQSEQEQRRNAELALEVVAKYVTAGTKPEPVTRSPDHPSVRLRLLEETEDGWATQPGTKLVIETLGRQGVAG